ncbi:restriction endonuclease subunit S [Pseudomonas oryzihabitans]|uniref:restriction endonuclease subunit S n=1 Tax=Pseudomonas oryzihabitans TaxID=47885 RepID=UPI00119DD672|nr:restriction endonuclease subunit S [Pseudomonas oryzihabitans]
MEVRPGYKQTEVGVIPGEWVVKPLKDVGRFFKGKGLLKEDIKASGRIPAIPYTALYTDFSELLNYDHIKWFIDDETQTYIVSEPCVLIASSSNMAANTGKASALTRTTPVAIGREVIVFKTASDCSYISFLLSTSSYRQKTLSLARGTTIKHLYPATFQDYKIALPPNPEQRAIATALSDVDALLDALERLIAKKRELKQAAMQQLLTGQTRLPGFHGEWEVKRLEEVAEIVMGQSPSSSNYNARGDGLPLIQGNADVANRKTVARIFTTQITKRGRAGDILMSVRAPVGEVSRATFDLCLGRGVCAIRYPNDFLYYSLIFLEPMWAKHSKGSTFESVSSTDVRGVELKLPSDLAEQTAIATLLSDMDAELAALEQRLAKTRALKQGMMQELLTGRTRLV